MSQEIDNNKVDLFKQKVFYPYEYMSDFQKVEKELPSKEKFYNSLTGKKLVAKKMTRFWKLEINLKWKRWKSLYLKCEVLLLVLVFEKFRNNSLNNSYGLFPSYYLSAPFLSWDAMLTMTKLELEFNTDSDMYIFL